MSFDVRLKDKEGNTLISSMNISHGGTQVIGGTNECDLNITYNYAEYFYKHLCPIRGLRCLHGQEAKRCIEVLENAVAKLGTVTDADYWKNTNGNAGYSLNILSLWAKEHPDGIFEVQ
jgi:hypothetical protein